MISAVTRRIQNTLSTVQSPTPRQPIAHTNGIINRYPRGDAEARVVDRARQRHAQAADAQRALEVLARAIPSVP